MDKDAKVKEREKPATEKNTLASNVADLEKELDESCKIKNVKKIFVYPHINSNISDILSYP